MFSSELRKIFLLFAFFFLWLAQPCSATWANVGARGTAQNKISANSLVITVATANVAVGNILEVMVACDNTSTVDGDNNEVPSVIDSQSNTYVQLREHTNSNAAAAAGVTIAVFASKITTALVSGTDTVTINFASARDSKAGALREFSVAAGKTFAVADSNATVQDAGTTPSVATANMDSHSRLFLGIVGAEGPSGDVFTQDADYTDATTRVGTSGGGAATNMTNNNGFRIASLISDAYNPTLGTARDSASIIVALDEVNPANGNLDVTVLTYAIVTTTGNIKITGSGFTPKVGIFISAFRSPPATGSGLQLSVGVGISSTERRMGMFHGRNGTDPSWTSSESREDRVLLHRSAADLLQDETDLVSMDANGVTINKATTDASDGVQVTLMLIGGTDLTNAKLVTFTQPGITGLFSITTVGFQGDFLMLFSTPATVLSTITDHGGLSIGFAKSSTAAALCSVMSEDNAAPSDSRRYCRNNGAEVWARLSEVDDNAIQRNDFSQFLSNGFELNAIETTASATQIFALVLKGPQFHIGNFLTQTAAGTFDVTGSSFQPRGVMAITHVTSQSTLDVPQTTLKWSYGAASSSTARGAAFAIDPDNIFGNFDKEHYGSFSRAYVNYSNLDPAVLDGDVDFDQFLSNGFRLNQTDADPAQSFAIYWSIGPAAALAGCANPMALLGAGCR